tara:strand:- start:2 stop:475 length:474 start_codon:yes stop_codon:yes gene_type:complete
MEKIESKELSLHELNKKVYDLTKDIEDKENEIKTLNARIQRHSVLSVSENLTVHKSSKNSYSVYNVLIKQGNHNVCKLYGTVRHKMVRTSLFAKQITLIPRMLSIVSKIVDGEYMYTLADEAENILYEASAESIEWASVSAPKSENKYILQSKIKEQ